MSGCTLTEITEPYKLDDLPEGHDVLDAMGDRWIKHDKWWTFPDSPDLTSAELLNIWGPVKVDLSYLDEPQPEPSTADRIRAAGAEVARLFSLSAEEAQEAMAKFAKEFDPYPAQQELKDRLNSRLARPSRDPGAPINWRGL